MEPVPLPIDIEGYPESPIDPWFDQLVENHKEFCSQFFFKGFKLFLGIPEGFFSAFGFSLFILKDSKLL